MMKKYNSKMLNADKVTRTVTTYRICWKARNFKNEEIVKFFDCPCKVDKEDLFNFVYDLYKDNDNGVRDNSMPCIMSNDDVWMEEKEHKYDTTVSAYIQLCEGNLFTMQEAINRMTDFNLTDELYRRITECNLTTLELQNIFRDLQALMPKLEEKSGLHF